LRILFVCHRFPFPPSRGGKIRPFNIIKHLTESGHEVHVASIARSADEAKDGKGLSEHCAGYLMAQVRSPLSMAKACVNLATTTPSSMGYFHSPRLARDIRDLLDSKSFDLIFVHCSSVAQYVEHVHDIPKIMDFGDMDSQKWLTYAQVRPFPMSPVYWLEGTKLERAERRIASRFEYCTCTTRAELDTLREQGTAPATGWFPNGVDTNFFAPSDVPYEPNTICFIGRMDYYPNQQAMFDFCDRVLPQLREERPETKLLVVGASPSRKVRALGRIPGVTVTGSVPDVRPFVHSAAMTIAPLSIARGTQNKVLESMAMGVPVVVSDVAAGGVDAVPNEQLLTASTPSEWVAAIRRLLDDPSERERFSKAARARVLSNHSWKHSMEVLDTLIEDCMERAGSGAQKPAAAATSPDSGIINNSKQDQTQE